MMTREEAKKAILDKAKNDKLDKYGQTIHLLSLHTIVEQIYDAHEAELTKACEILEGANIAEIERHFAECKAKDERIAKLEAKLDSLAQFLEGLNPYNQII